MISLQYKFNWIDSQYESILEIPISHVLYCVVEVFPFNGKWQFRFNKRNGVGNFETKLEASDILYLYLNSLKGAINND